MTDQTVSRNCGERSHAANVATVDSSIDIHRPSLSQQQVVHRQHTTGLASKKTKGACFAERVKKM